MAFLDLNGLARFKQKIQAWVQGIVGSESMGTQATTLTGAIAEHSGEIAALEAVDPVLSVNSATPDEYGNVQITTVDNAINIVSDDTQASEGTFVTRTTGGDASISDGDAWLNIVRGNSVHAGYTPRNLVMTVDAVPTIPRSGAISATVDRNSFVSIVSESSTIEFNYGVTWNIDPSLYAITVTGTPIDGDSMVVDYTKEDIDFTLTTATRPTPAGISAQIDNSTFIAAVTDPGTYTTTYTSSWDNNPATWGITVTGTPENGDNIVVEWDGEHDPEMTVNSERQPDAPITATFNRSTFVSYVSQSGVTTLSYTNAWSADPSLYGVTVTGTPISGDQIVIYYTKEVIDLTVTPAAGEPRTNPITAVIDEDAYDAAILTSGTMVFTYTSDWSIDPEDYGITVSNTPIQGDKITVSCTKEVRGSISMFNPAAFYSTNWNLYSRTLGYARTLKYSDTYNFILGGSFESDPALICSPTTDPNDPDAYSPTITVDSGFFRFAVNADCFTFISGTVPEDAYIMMTWSDWTDGYEGDYVDHTASVIDLSSIITEQNFPYGLAKAGSVVDEINLTMKTATSKITRQSWSLANLEAVKATGRAYEYDEDYIYVEKEVYDTYSIPSSFNNQYVANDHGLEVFTNTTVPGYALTLYGQNLKDKLRTDVVTISHQDLTAVQKENFRNNIDAVSIDTAQTITGSKTFKGVPVIQQSSNSSGMQFKSNKKDDVLGTLVMNGLGSSTSYPAGAHFEFNVYGANSDGTRSNYSRSYKLPGPPADMTASDTDNIITEKTYTNIPNYTGATSSTPGIPGLVPPTSLPGTVLTGGGSWVFGLANRGTLPSGSNFNDYKNAETGLWTVSNNASGETMTNSPETRAGSLVVLRNYNSAYVWQYFFPYDADNYFYRRRNTSSTGWNTWKKFSSDAALTTTFDAKYVALTGDQTISGVKTFNDSINVKNTSLSLSSGGRYRNINFVMNTATNGTGAKIIFDAGNSTNQTANRIYFQTYSPLSTAGTANTGHYERYYIPKTAAGLSEEKTYSLLSSRDKVTIAQGGTGMDSVGSTTTISDIATAANSVTITAASYKYWGKVAQVYIKFKLSSAVSSGSKAICTIPSGKRPAAAAAAVVNSDGVTGYVTTGGVMTSYGAIAANTEQVMMATYILA